MPNARRFAASALLLPLPIVLIACVMPSDDDGMPREVPLGADALLVETELPPGERCPAGGTLLRGGTDADSDGELDDDEASVESVVCHGDVGPVGEAGSDAPLLLHARDPVSPGETCAAGGWRLSSGHDDDDDGTLSTLEVDDTYVVCHGPPATGPTLGSLSCAGGQVPAFVDGAWSCSSLPSYDGADFALSGQACPAGSFAAGFTPDGALACEPVVDTLARLACAPGEVPKWSGVGWSCAPDDITAAGSDTLSALSCGDGEVAKWSDDDDAWVCAADVDTDTDTDTLAALACGDGEVAKWSAASSTWTCGADLLSLPGSDTLAALSCADGEVAKWSDDGDAWVCAPDVDTDTDTDTDTLASLSCADGQIAKWSGSAWACADDIDTDTDTDTDSDTLLELSAACATGDVPKWDGAAWACAPDDDDDTDTDTLAGLSCAAGQVAKWSGSAWACADDVDTDTDTDTLGSLACADGEVPKWSGAAWACADDVDTDSDGDTLAGLSCADGQVAKWSGSVWACADDVDTDTDTLLTLDCGPGQLPKWSGSAWECADDVDTDTDTLAGLSCADGQVAKWSGSAWGCASDVDTDGDTLAALSCTSGEVAKWSGSAWACGADATGGADTLASLSCADGEVVKWSAAANAWGCAVDDAVSSNGPFTTTIVVGGGATPQANGSSLYSVLAGIGGSADDPYLVKLEPGLYDVGTSALPVRSFVHVEGSGVGVTKILSASAPTAVTVAAHAALRDLSIEVSADASVIGGAARNVTLERVSVRLLGAGTALVFNASTHTGLSLRDVDVEASAAGGECRGAYLDAADLSLERVRVSLSGCSVLRGLWLVSGGSVRDTSVTLDDGGTSPTTLRGIEWQLGSGEVGVVTDTAVTITSAATNNPAIIGLRLLSDPSTTPAVDLDRVDVDIRASNTGNAVVVSGIESDIDAHVRRTRVALSSGGATQAMRTSRPLRLESSHFLVDTAQYGRGVWADGPAATLAIAHSTVESLSPSTASWGLYLDRAPLRLDGSSVRGGFARAIWSVSADVLVGASQLDAPTPVYRSGTPTLKCVASYDGAYGPLPAGCL